MRNNTGRLVALRSATAAKRQLIQALSSSATKATTTDTLIIGGGPVGSSSAYHLARQRGGNGSGIVVVEKDPTYQSRNCSAVYSAGGIRQQFSLTENINMSLYGRDFLRGADDLLATKDGEHYDVQFKEHGYLFLAGTESGRNQMVKNHNTQVEAGCKDIKLLDTDELRSQFPWLNTEDILLGSYGEKGEGWFDPHALIMGLKAKAIEMGVKYVHGTPVAAKSEESSGKVLSVDIEEKNGDIVAHNINYAVNAAGAQAEGVMNLLAGGPEVLKYPLPVKPRKRCIFFFHCAVNEGVPPVAPLTVDPSFVYFRSEGSGENATFLCGVSPAHDQDPDIYNHGALDGADHHLFENIIWPALFHRVPAFGDIKVRSSWAGLYEYNVIDQNGIIAFHPEMTNILMLNGFSGHGLQQSPAVGRAAAELIDSGRFESLDLSIFSFDRCMGLAEPVLEEGIV
eukprot:CAMPEP_0197718324 /NCGR_PEP_ID=MMETSP1434-20131217/2523_1 /TAXON_ID=265543 /ORGANISM="Minutocellus polymorphus, Strain CCMP3303" /LENGTH=453 /DNA_ID=CAMNT_0043302961 /DNA_START=35 /DNA_END=1396 /DNA_ORIENTATION=+